MSPHVPTTDHKNHQLSTVFLSLLLPLSSKYFEAKLWYINYVTHDSSSAVLTDHIF